MPEEEALQTGYGAGAPIGDNLANDFQQETAASYAELARARGDRAERHDGLLTVTDSALPLPFWNRAVLEQPATDAGALVDSLRAFYGPGPADAPFLLDSLWPTPDLREHGFVLMGHPPLMVRPPGLELPAPPPELQIVEVTNADGAADLERTLIDGYPAPALQPFETVRMFTPEVFAAAGWRHFVGYVDGRPVAAGSSYTGARVVRVENIATLSDVRGRGYGNAVTAAAIGVALDRPTVLVASDLGRPVYERLGFAALLRVTYWLGMR